MWTALKNDASFMDCLQDPGILDLLSSALFEHSIPNNNNNNKAIAATSSSIQHYNTIPTGTGLRRQNRQFPTLKDYMKSFIFSDEGTEDLTPEAVDALITKESAIRLRLHALHERGGFSTHLQQLAHRRPHHHPTKHPLVHDHLLRDMAAGAKLVQTTTKYKRTMARKCAKAVDRYWETLRSQDERARRDEAKRLQRLAKWTCQQVKKKWKVVERVCEARYKEVVKEQQAVEGRKHLQMILEHSQNMLDVRQEELRLHQQNQQLVDEEEDAWHSMDEEDARDHIIEKDDEESDDDQAALRELEEDQNLTVEELMKKYQAMKEETASSVTEEEETASSVMEEDDDDAEFSVNEEEDVPIEDDGESEDDDAELNALNEDANLTVEQLIEKYKYQPTTTTTTSSSTRSSSVETDYSSRRSSSKRRILPSFADTNTEDGSSLAEDEHANTTAEIRPTGNTLATTKVQTPIPPLLRGTLREYQHVGLDWLASLYNNGLNGILADEMGLGKTIQTISLLAHLACERGIWGPHLVVVPTSVILNWEMEFKKWLPGFKIMTYYGTPKERKEKRVGWSKDNAFHVCITSYQLVLQDQSIFRRKQWQYLILDEAHHIKNFRSQRWQVLLNFNSKRRLLLTGTPLQNNLMELWSLLYFLMPNGVSQDMPIGFANLKEFQEWFSHPVDRMIEGQQGVDEESRKAIQKLHTVLRPYLLRRLKADVEKQMPQKHEHIVYCRLSKRQRYLYDDFMARGKTKETLASGNFLSIINCLMQLRKVCNHPDLFEERPILTSFAMDDAVQYMGASIETLVRKRLFPTCKVGKVNLNFMNLVLTDPSQQAVMSGTVADETLRLEATQLIMKTIGKHQRRIAIAESRGVTSRDYHDLKKYAKYREMQMHIAAVNRWEQINYVNHFRCARRPVYDANLVDLLSPAPGYMYSRDPRQYQDHCESLNEAVQSYKTRIHNNLGVLEQFGFVTPKVVMAAAAAAVSSNPSTIPCMLQLATNVENDIFHPIQSRLSIAFPDKRLLQYDCGKLQKLAALLRTLAAGGHRALIFTQMTRVLDVLETFLNMHGHRYLRLDGATKVEQRQVLTEHFNSDTRILCFILSTRSGGLGINLTGADTVIFYDSDWNPSMDKQCQDRAHRIGQTRDVHIYRFVTEFTIEENIFKKANQKRYKKAVFFLGGWLVGW
jgi:helicase SWR1